MEAVFTEVGPSTVATLRRSSLRKAPRAAAAEPAPEAEPKAPRSRSRSRKQAATPVPEVEPLFLLSVILFTASCKRIANTVRVAAVMSWKVPDVSSLHFSF